MELSIETHVSPTLEAAYHSGAMPRSRLVSLMLAIAVLTLFALSVARTYALGQHDRMYDNPVYRWRESLAIALSRMQNPPLHGYLAYRSIRNYLAEHGLALVAGEAAELSTPEERRDLTHDGARMNRLIQGGSRTPIDEKLPPVILMANELGEADFFYWAFQLFGLNLNAFVVFYYSILLLSVALFFVTFRHSPFCILLLMLYLAGHFFAVQYATIGHIQTIHNSRFFSVLALLPTMHLLLLMLRRERPNWPNIAGAAAQAFILLFMLFCRSQVFWQVLAILASAPLAVRMREIWPAVWQPRLWPVVIKRVTRDAWPALVVACGLVGYAFYATSVPDPRFYGSQSKGHVFWHALYVGTISANDQLTSLYGYEQERYGDGMGYVTVLHDLRGWNEAPPEFAEVVDGVLNINFLKDAGAYDQAVRRVFFEVLAEHPWLALRSFLIGKPVDQLEILTHMAPLREVRPYVQMFILALVASAIALLAGAGVPDRESLRHLALALVPLVICSGLTTAVVPSPIVPDLIVLYLMLVSLLLAYLPLALLWRRVSASRRSKDAMA